MQMNKNLIVDDDVEKIILLRKRMGLRQYELAKELGISKNYLTRIENYKNPLVDKLKKKIFLYFKENGEEI